jgi:sec-independent protein translocase protein TatA
MGFVNVGPLELLVIGVIALLVLGPKRLPEAARSVGRGMREMKEALQGNDDEDDYQKEADSIASSSSSSGRE